MAKTHKDFSLREKKYARTKIALVQEFMDRMKTTRFSEIPIKEVCEKVEVSEGTFYNYFHHKMEILEYYFILAFLKVIWTVENDEGRKNYRQKIEYIFDHIANEIQEPFMFYEIMSVKTSEHLMRKEEMELTEVEKVLAFPDCEGIEHISTSRIDQYFEKILKAAQKDKQLPAGVSVDDLLVSLMSTMIGVPLTIETEDFGKLKKLFGTQLSLLWGGLDHKGKKS